VLLVLHGGPGWPNAVFTLPLRPWEQHMAWAFRTNVPTPNLDRRMLFPLALSSPIYTLRDLFSLFTGFQWSTGQMFEELRAYDARRLGPRLEVPFFLFQGERDVVTLTTLAEEYFQEGEAPTKELALIPDAATSPPSPSRSGSRPSCAPGSGRWQPRPASRPPGRRDRDDHNPLLPSRAAARHMIRRGPPARSPRVGTEAGGNAPDVVHLRSGLR
jgi:hypothetical protein